MWPFKRRDKEEEGQGQQNVVSNEKKQKEEDMEDMEKVVCIECDIKTQQKELPPNDSLSGAGMPCEVEYNLVSTCMKEQAGQVSACVVQWDDFKLCHQRQREQKQQQQE